MSVASSLETKNDGSEFSDNDEEVLTLFASQAAAAIVNARTYQAEQRARVDLEALIDTSPFGVVVIDARSGVTKSVNREVQRIFEQLCAPGLPLEELLGELVLQFEDGSEVLVAQPSVVGELINEKTVHAEEIVLSIPDGRSVTVLVHSMPIQYPEGDDVVILTLQDLDPLEERERQRETFLHMVSHELRAPLATITGSAVTLEDTQAKLEPAEMSAYFRLIIEQAEHMRDLISDLLDAGHINSGTLSVSPEPTAVSALVDKAQHTFVRGGGRHEIVTELAADLPEIMSDRRRIQQVLSNLFMNAARHAPETTPIRISATREGPYVSIAVQNEGRGIAPDRLVQIFQKHANDDTKCLSEGLALAICKGLVEAHGGRIDAESSGRGEGMLITFTLPSVSDSAKTQTEPSDVSSGTNYLNKRKRILVVDDDPLTLRLVRETLSEGGYAVTASSDPRDLPKLIKSERPDLVLLEIVFPEADGIELLENSNELANLPVIFISGYGRDKTIAHALDSGARDYIVKPFSPVELIARVRVALRGSSGLMPFELDGLTIHFDEHRVAVDGEGVELTATEFELLRVLARGAGRVMTYDNLLYRVWPGDGNTRLVRTFVKQLRRKLGDDPRNPRWIFNQRGAGYFMPKPNDT